MALMEFGCRPGIDVPVFPAHIARMVMFYHGDNLNLPGGRLFQILLLRARFAVLAILLAGLALIKLRCRHQRGDSLQNSG